MFVCWSAVRSFIRSIRIDNGLSFGWRFAIRKRERAKDERKLINKTDEIVYIAFSVNNFIRPSAEAETVTVAVIDRYSLVLSPFVRK